MGKRELRVIRVPRPFTVALLIVVSAGMAGLIAFLSGHAYVREPSFADIASMTRFSGIALLAAIAPLAADILFFMPWGFLAFLAIDRQGRPRRGTYMATIGLGVAFALLLSAWQETLPTRVTGRFDVFWNAVGCACGAVLGHVRKRVRLRFE